MLNPVFNPTESTSEADVMGDNDYPSIKFYPLTSALLSDRHKRVARMIGHGFSDLLIAEACGLQSRAVQEIRDRPEVQAYVARLKDLARLEVIEQKDMFDELLHKSIRVYEEVLDDPKASQNLRVKVASAVMDRHPDGQFVRGNKTMQQTRHIVDGDAIARLKERAFLTEAEAIDVSAPPFEPDNH